MNEAKDTAALEPPEELAGFTAKLNRADEHRNQLYSEVNGWVALDPVASRHEIDQTAGEIRVYCQFDPVPDIDRWAVIIGDIVHNLRSALDHLAWQLVVLNGEEPHEGDTAFPIFRSKSAWRDHSGYRVEGMSEAAITDIERLQPYHRGDNAEKTLLWMLHQMNRDDKHRLLTPVVLRSEKFRWKVEPEPIQITLTPTMEHGAAFMFVKPSQGLDKVHVQIAMASHVAIDFGSGRRIEIGKLLGDIRNQVSRIGNIFGRFFF